MLVRKKYIRDSSRNPVGCMLAIEKHGKILFGWSLCGRNDRFNRQRATLIANGRAETSLNRDVTVHPKITDMFNEFKTNVLNHTEA
jgi:hypothetical protein